MHGLRRKMTQHNKKHFLEIIYTISRRNIKISRCKLRINFFYNQTIPLLEIMWLLSFMFYFSSRVFLELGLEENHLLGSKRHTPRSLEIIFMYVFYECKACHILSWKVPSLFSITPFICHSFLAKVVLAEDITFLTDWVKP